MPKTHWNDRIIAGEMPYYCLQIPLTVSIGLIPPWFAEEGRLILIVCRCPIKSLGWHKRESTNRRINPCGLD